MTRNELRQAARAKVVTALSEKMTNRLRSSSDLQTEFSYKVAKMEDTLDAEYAAKQKELDTEYKQKQRDLEKKIEEMRKKLGESTGAAAGTRSIEIGGDEW